jgi:hypothetical protein
MNNFFVYLFAFLCMYVLFLKKKETFKTNDYLNYLDTVRKIYDKDCLDLAEKSILYCQPKFYSRNKL